MRSSVRFHHWEGAWEVVVVGPGFKRFLSAERVQLAELSQRHLHAQSPADDVRLLPKYPDQSHPQPGRPGRPRFCN